MNNMNVVKSLMLALAVLPGYLLASHFEEVQEWSLLGIQSGVEVHYRLEPCDGTNRIVFKIQNNNELDYDLNFECKVKTSDGLTFSSSVILTISGNQILEGRCSDSAASPAFVQLPPGVNLESVEGTFNNK